MEVKNRREKILTSALPPKILTVSEIESQLDEDGYVKREDIPSTGFTVTLIGELDSALTGAGTKDITCTEKIESYNVIMIYCTNNDDQGACTIVPVTDFIANATYTLVALSTSGNLSNGYIKMKVGDETGKVVTLEAKASTKFKTLKIYGVK